MFSYLIKNKFINMRLIIIGKRVYLFIKLFIYKIQQIVIKNKIRCKNYDELLLTNMKMLVNLFPGYEFMIYIY